MANYGWPVVTFGKGNSITSHSTTFDPLSRNLIVQKSHTLSEIVTIKFEQFLVSGRSLPKIASITDFYFMSLLDVMRTSAEVKEKNVSEQTSSWIRLASSIQSCRRKLSPSDLEQFDSILAGDNTTASASKETNSWIRLAESIQNCHQELSLSDLQKFDSILAGPSSTTSTPSAPKASCPPIAPIALPPSPPPTPEPPGPGSKLSQLSSNISPEPNSKQAQRKRKRNRNPKPQNEPVRLLRTIPLQGRNGFLYNESFPSPITLAQQCLGLPYSIGDQEYHPTRGSLQDAVIICIDFENILEIIHNPRSKRLWTQMGVCILDTRLFSSAPSSASPEGFLQTCNFSTTTTSNRPETQLRDELFLFGKTKRIHAQALSQQLETLIDRSRNNIILGHDVQNELLALDTLGFDLKTGISAIVDTQQVMKMLFCPDYPADQIDNIPRSVLDTRLQGLVNKMGIASRADDFHVAENDVNFTLKAFLLLVVESFKGVKINREVKQRLQFIRSIGKSKWLTGSSTILATDKAFLPTQLPSSKFQFSPTPPRKENFVSVRLTRTSEKVDLLSSIFEPMRGRLEHEQHQIFELNDSDRNVLEARNSIGFSKFLVPSSVWWKQAPPMSIPS